MGDWVERGRVDTRDRNRPEHAYEGNGLVNCLKCDLPLLQHRVRPVRSGKRGIDRRHRKDSERATYIGIDGEGQGRADHRYVLLAASDEEGNREWVAEASNPRIGRLTTVECLDMILELPTRRAKVFSFSFNYDITKILTDLDNKSLFYLFRPEMPERQRPKCEAFKGPYPVAWCPKCKGECEHEGAHYDDIYKLNLLGTKFVVKKAKKRVVIWDLFKFFQSKFVAALEDWKVPGGDGSEESAKARKIILDNMREMKDQRADFDKLNHGAVKDYCLEECRCIAELARRLIEAHNGANLKLKSYYGAGSSGAAMLTAMGIKKQIFPPRQEMRDAIASAFFGGRFENSVIGAIREPLVNLDISSAYVYQLAFLPCLEHGSWSHTKRRKDLEKAEAQNGALVRYSLGNPGIEASWGPFPFRTRDGTISFPRTSGGGWVWLDEYVAGERVFPNVKFHEAWIYSSNCACKPFARIPEYYNLRLKIGKEGPGIVIKLGMNSCYGKLAQSVGNALFNSWIWAGMITSGCRAQILDVMGLHKDKRNLLMIATDGIYTREIDIVPPEALPTKTDELYPDDKGVLRSKPLGGWEIKHCPKGVFVARPGIYFPLEPTKEEIKSVRARGVGRSVVLESWQIILDAWEKKGVDGIAKVANVSRFCGAKTSISVSGKEGAYKFKRAKSKDPKRPTYGQWISREVALSFDPMPKRASVNADGVTLALRTFPKDLVSTPYGRAVIGMSKESKELAAAKQEIMEQPDGDLQDYEYS
jgi:hypothetical protein